MTDHVLADFEEALARLLVGEPQSPRLKARALTKPVRISFATVAEEAGRSRTLIGHDGCPYPKFRERLRRIIEDGPSARDTREALGRSAAKLRLLHTAIAEKDSIQAALLLELINLRREAPASSGGSRRLRVVK